MKANQKFNGRSLQFWGYIRIISEKMGYSKRGVLKKFNFTEISTMLIQQNISIEPNLLEDVIDYLNYRADILNNSVQQNLMNAEEARKLFKEHQLLHSQNSYTCKLPFNKQKEEKKDHAYLTGLVNILTEQTLKQFANDHNLIYGQDVTVNEDPGTLTYIKDKENKIQGAFSRRYDGAFPSTTNPRAIWEIKEYYYTTTFGSRIADGVYETQLDGYEINEVAHMIEGNIKHIYIIDAHYTWWVKGKSYLCRIIDMLHMGLVDEVIFGKEVIQRWPQVIRKIAEDHYSSTN